MNRPSSLSALVAGFGLVAVPALAHHSASAEFDASKPIVLHGIVTRMVWLNPHVHFFVDVKEDSGKLTNWEFEWDSPNALRRAGWTRTSLERGDEVTVKFWRAKDSPSLANAIEVSTPGMVLAGGRGRVE